MQTKIATILVLAVVTLCLTYSAEAVKCYDGPSLSNKDGCIYCASSVTYANGVQGGTLKECAKTCVANVLNAPKTGVEVSCCNNVDYCNGNSAMGVRMNLASALLMSALTAIWFSRS